MTTATKIKEIEATAAATYQRGERDLARWFRAVSGRVGCLNGRWRANALVSQIHEAGF
jgi:hypothetical protein